MAQVRNIPIYKNGAVVSYYTGDDAYLNSTVQSFGGSLSPTAAPTPAPVQTPAPAPAPVNPVPQPTPVQTPTPTPAPVSKATAPTVELKPGDTGEAVKQLQDYLVSAGFLTDAQKNTGYGTYGPQTKAAVEQLQNHLGIDNSSGPGFFGPKTLAAVTQRQVSAPVNTTADTKPSVNNAELDTLLNNPNLSSDQKTLIRSIYDAVHTNDTATAGKITAAMEAATAYSDPYFKAQVTLATDALDRGLNQKDGDFSYQENSLKTALAKLTQDTAASKDQLSFEHQQELLQLAKKYESDLSDTRDSLASSGFTNSSKRARAEQILTDANSGLVESSNKTYGYQTGSLDRTLSSGEADTAAQIENLKRLSAAGKLDLKRTAEAQVGSETLAGLGYSDILGNIGGSIPAAKAKDALSFANSFVF